MDQQIDDNFSRLFATLYILLIISSVTLNIIILTGLLGKPRKQLRDQLIISMSVADLLRIFLVCPLLIRSLLHQRKKIDSNSLCQSVSFLTYVFEHASIGHLVFVVLDRFVCTCHPTFALRLYLRATTALKCISFSYINAMFWAILPLLGVGRYGLQSNKTQCGILPLHDSISKAYITLLLVFVYGIPFLLIFYCLNRIWKHTMRQNEIQNTDTSSGRPSETLEYIQSDKQQFGLVLGLTIAFILTWFIYFFVLFEEIYFARNANPYLEIATTFTGQCSALVVPALIIYFYKDVKRHLLEINRRRKRTIGSEITSF